MPIIAIQSIFEKKWLKKAEYEKYIEVRLGQRHSDFNASEHIVEEIPTRDCDESDFSSSPYMKHKWKLAKYAYPLCFKKTDKIIMGNGSTSLYSKGLGFQITKCQGSHCADA